MNVKSVILAVNCVRVVENKDANLVATTTYFINKCAYNVVSPNRSTVQSVRLTIVLCVSKHLIYMLISGRSKQNRSLQHYKLG
jgi:hypothetical protein